LGAYARHTDNMRAALDWAFSSSGDAAVGVALTAAAVPLWFQQSLMLECRGRVERRAGEPRTWLGSRRPPRDAALRSTGRVADANEGACSGHDHSVGQGPGDCRALERHRVSAARALGPVAFSRQPRRVSSRADTGGKILRACREHGQSGGDSRGPSDDRRLAPLSGRPDESTASPRVRAG
jgi:hypothetical protein